MKEAGVSEDMILRLTKEGRPPDGWQVHHILSLDDGGTNEFNNLLLIKNDPYHKAISGYQRSVTGGLKAGDTFTVKWPVIDDIIYP